MAEKHVLITLNRAPFGTIFYTEGLRAAVGVTAGVDENTVDVALLGDGVYYALKGVDRSDSAVYLKTMADQGRKMKVEEESLKERGLNASHLAEDTEVISRSEVLKLVAAADVTIDF